MLPLHALNPERIYEAPRDELEGSAIRGILIAIPPVVRHLVPDRTWVLGGGAMNREPRRLRDALLLALAAFLFVWIVSAMCVEAAEPYRPASVEEVQ